MIRHEKLGPIIGGDVIEKVVEVKQFNSIKNKKLYNRINALLKAKADCSV